MFHNMSEDREGAVKKGMYFPFFTAPSLFVFNSTKPPMDKTKFEGYNNIVGNIRQPSEMCRLLPFPGSLCILTGRACSFHSECHPFG